MIIVTILFVKMKVPTFIAKIIRIIPFKNYKIRTNEKKNFTIYRYCRNGFFVIL